MKKGMNEKVLKLVAKTAYRTAEHSANSSCLWYAYQPKLPKGVKELRKF